MADEPLIYLGGRSPRQLQQWSRLLKDAGYRNIYTNRYAEALVQATYTEPPTVIIGDRPTVHTAYERLRTDLFQTTMRFIVLAPVPRKYVFPRTSFFSPIYYIQDNPDGRPLLKALAVDERRRRRYERRPRLLVYREQSFEQRFAEAIQTSADWHFLDCAINDFDRVRRLKHTLLEENKLRVVAAMIAEHLYDHGTARDFGGYRGEGRFGVISYAPDIAYVAQKLSEGRAGRFSASATLTVQVQR